MGADMYLNPPEPPPKDHVVVVNRRGEWVEHVVYGPYTKSRARTVLRKVRGRGEDAAVRKMTHYEEPS